MCVFSCRSQEHTLDFWPSQGLQVILLEQEVSAGQEFVMGPDASMFPLPALLMCYARHFLPAFHWRLRSPHVTLGNMNSGFLRQGCSPSCSLHALDERHFFFFLACHKVLNMSFKLVKGKASFARVINM